MSLLVARDLCVAPPGSDPLPALRGLSLAIDRGEWVAIGGPNGGGKSSLALAVAGLWPTRGGTLELDGQPFGPRADLRLRAQVAAVLQEPATQLLESTVRAELGFAARNLGLPEERITSRTLAWSDRLGLGPDLDRDPRSLSAGRQQLVLVGAALVAEPRLLVADEAGAHLDSASRARVLETLRKEVRAGLGVLWVTQEPEEQRAADRCLIVGASGANGVGPDPPPATGVPTSGSEAGDTGEAKASGHPLLRLAVSPWSGAEGPHVATERPLVIEVEDRGVVALEGRNGSGKSVLLAAAAGLSRVDQIAVTWLRPVEGAPILAAQSPELQLFEEHVGDEVAYAATSRGVELGRARALAARAFENLGLGGASFLKRRSWDLSAGEKRLLQIVAALIAPSSVVLIDEPTCGLDPWRRAGLLNLVRDRAEIGPVVVATQDEGWARRLGARRLRIGS